MAANDAPAGATREVRMVTDDAPQGSTRRQGLFLSQRTESLINEEERKGVGRKVEKEDWWWARPPSRDSPSLLHTRHSARWDLRPEKHFDALAVVSPYGQVCSRPMSCHV